MNDDVQRFQQNLTSLHLNPKVSNLKVTHNPNDPDNLTYRVEANGPPTDELRKALSQMTTFLNENVVPIIPADLQDAVYLAAGQLRVKLDHQSIFRHLHGFNRKDLTKLRDRITSKGDASRLMEEAILAADQESRATISLIENELSPPLAAIGFSATFRFYPSPPTLMLEPLHGKAKKTS